MTGRETLYCWIFVSAGNSSPRLQDKLKCYLHLLNVRIYIYTLSNKYKGDI